ncbi:hypothetical protein LAJ19_12930 [Deinococcus taeanensis]|uniref:hypothetical protein n=1 Tax=Deinococcus taeanensis TaxID=2737050 RepID=UPI001CDC7FD9|nr:hypothetical protein [Deinococcus taeanensis]UBV42514.1 hypothetical protein LAJ19_12930 [Deinococcus taeanensis]
MTDDQKTGYDPANQSPAEGQRQDIPEQARGKDPDIDPAAKPDPAEGGRDEVEGDSTPQQS